MVPADDRCVGSAQAAIIGGASSAAAGLGPAVAAAIGQIETDAGEVLCTATLIADRFVLTASHCARSEGVFFRVDDGSAASVRVPVMRAHAHPRVDIMLAELSIDDAMKVAGVAAHLELFHKPAESPWPERLTLAGRGEREDGFRGELRFATEPVQSVDATTLTVQGNGTSGACGGDSGGPLLLVNANGGAAIVGELSSGSSSCTGIDVYTRVDRIQGWIADTMQRAAVAGCGNVSELGACTAAGPRWCAGRELHAEACSGKNACGFDRALGRYGCVDSERDPCLGIGPEWTCLGGEFVRCQDRTSLQTFRCAGCGMTCQLTARGAECAPAD